MNTPSNAENTGHTGRQAARNMHLSIAPCLLASHSDLSTGSGARLYQEEVQHARANDPAGLISICFTSLVGCPRENLDPSKQTSHTDSQLERIARSHREARLFREDIAHYASGFCKTAALFLPGKVGWTASGLVFALEEIRPGTGAKCMMLDTALGFCKGVSSKGFLTVAHTKQWSPVKTGVLMGGFNRFVDTGFSRTNWTNNEGALDTTKGAINLTLNTLNPVAVGMDCIIFRVGNSAFSSLNGRLGYSLDKNFAARYFATGATLGMSSGFFTEGMRQLADNDFSIKRLAYRTFAQGLCDGVAGLPGGIWQNNISLRRARQCSDRETLENAATRIRPAEITRASLETLIKAQEELGNSYQVFETPTVLKEGRPQPSENYSEWAKANLVSGPERPMRVYEIDGVQIVVPEQYDASLATVRAEWQRRAQAGLPIELPPEHPFAQLQNRLQPGELAQLIRSTPKPDLLRTVRLLDETNPDDAFVRQFDPSHRSRASSSIAGDVNLFKVERNGLLAEDFLHEWAHLARHGLPSARYFFDRAVEVDTDYHASTYARDGGIEENWAVHTAEEIANPDIARARHFAHRAPVRAAVIIKTLLDCLNDLPSHQKTSQHNQLESRLRELDAATRPLAQRALLAKMQISPGQVEAAVVLLLHLGTPESLSSVRVSDLHLAGVPISEGLMHNLSTLKGLNTLDLSGSEIQDHHMAHLSALNSLQKLSLRDSQVGTMGLLRLGPSRQLELLDLSNSQQIDASSVAILAGLRPRHLKLAGTSLAEADIANLRRLLPKSRIE